MKVLVVGGGGREHALIKKLKESPAVTAIYSCPGNGGIAADAQCVAIPASDLEDIARFAKDTGTGYCVVAPDDPLVAGAVDLLEGIGIPCFGPNKNAAIIEGSKAFSKALMKKYAIPTASYESFDEINAALAYIETIAFPAVIKADGLALGKGVVIAKTKDEGSAAVISMMKDKVFGESGSRVIIEEFLVGKEVSVLAFTDGKCVKPMVSSMDHKRALDGDKGLNTGGMGTVAPNPYYTAEIAARCMESIFLPTMRAMNAEGREFRGCLYFGLMLTADGPKVIEYNCRFGDPETQVVLPLLDSDLFEIMKATTEGRLSEIEIKWKSGAACCVIMASEGYPAAYKKGFPIELPDTSEGEEIYVAGAARDGKRLITSGGRVLGVTAVRPTLREAVSASYRLAENTRFANAYYRKDIGASALEALER